MRRFASLFDSIDRTTSTNAKVAAMAEYFAAAPPADAAWAVFFLTGRRLKRLVPAASIREWTLSATGLAPWMLDECYAVVGDGAETAALVLDQLPSFEPDDLSLARWLEERILPLRALPPDAQQTRVTDWWRRLDRLQRFILLKLLTGEFRVGVSQTLVVRALARAAELPPATVAARLMGDWTPNGAWFSALLSHEHTDEDRSRPFPFFLASPLEELPRSLGDPAEWLIEWKWDGIRAQIVRRGEAVHLWSRGEELITHRFPETNDEIAGLDRWIRRHTVERFGPVRHVETVHVFELGFEGISRSTRHQSGIAVRFPRMLRWRRDKKPEEADTLDTVRRLLERQEQQ